MDVMTKMMLEEVLSGESEDNSFDDIIKGYIKNINQLYIWHSMN